MKNPLSRFFKRYFKQTKVLECTWWSSVQHTVNLFKSVNTVNITSKPINNMLFAVLAVSMHARTYYAKPDCMPTKHSCSCKPKCTSAVRANQICKRILHAKHDAHGSRITSCVYTCAFIHHQTFVHTQATLCAFSDVSSCVVATFVCSQV